MCEKSETCPCLWHSMKINNDFVDILDQTFSHEEEEEIVNRLRQEWNEGQL